MADVVHIDLEFARAEHTAQPYAFEFSPQRYILRMPGYQGEAKFPWTPELLADLERLRHPGCEPEVSNRVGELLRAFLAGMTGWERHEQTIEDWHGDDVPIVVTIRSAAAELYVLPWELLKLRRSGLFLASVPGLVLRYDWPLVRVALDRVPAGERRGRVFFAWSAAGGEVPAQGHLAALRVGLGDRFEPKRDVIAHATLDALREALAAERGPPIDALHLLCRGAASNGAFALALSNDSGGIELVGANELGQLLARHADKVRMVVLAACDSGNIGALGYQVGSVAQRLHRVGVQVVVASRFPLSAAGSVAFTRTFYTCLAGGTPLAQAFSAARNGLRLQAEADWASIQLYVGAGDEMSLLLAPAVRPAAGEGHTGFLGVPFESLRGVTRSTPIEQVYLNVWFPKFEPRAPRFVVDVPIEMRVALGPQRHGAPTDPLSEDLLGRLRRLSQIDVWVQCADADVTPCDGTLHLPWPTNVLSFELTPRRPGGLRIVVVLLIHNQPVHRLEREVQVQDRRDRGERWG